MTAKPFCMTTNQKISAAILLKVAAGLSIREAIDAVLGAGTAARTIAEVYAAVQQ